MAASEDVIPIEKKLADIFKEAFEFFLKINDSTESTTDLQVQLHLIWNYRCNAFKSFALSAEDQEAHW